MAALQGPWMNHLHGLSQHFDEMVDIDGFGERDRDDKKFTKILHDACHVVWDAEKQSCPDLPEIVERAHTLIEKAFKYGFADLAMQHPHCYAYSKPPSKLPDFPKTDPWTRTYRPHPRTTRLSRFRDGITLPTSATTPRAHLVYQARATVRAEYMKPPAAMAISADGEHLFMASSAGYKSRDPSLKHYNLDEDPELDCGRRQDPGLSNTPDYLALDDERQLIFLADSDRIKSFRWGVSPSDDGAQAEGAGDSSKSKSKPRKRLPNVHTLNSEREYTGPLAVLPGGRVVRAGKGAAAVWNVDELATHQDVAPGALLGAGRLNTDNSWREADCAGVEHSAGLPPHAVVRFADDEGFQPAAWHVHRPTGWLLCGERSRDTDGFACVALDLEHGGRRAARFLGHGHDAERFATSNVEPNVFWTAGGDGFARMFDVRRPLPVLTFDTGGQSEGCADVVFVHPDGIPTLFTGGERTQQIKMWDIRARACVYELSTGNNGVSFMLWDDKRTTLLAASERGYPKYRKASIPRWATWGAIETSMKDYQKLSQDPSVSIAGEQTSDEATSTTGAPTDEDVKMEDAETAEDHESDWEDEESEGRQ
uniref:Ubiquitin ligase complex F-box protein GRR1, putative n=1 Tax=Ganoderma boninense TaxID=34458 RepID=A0A5K1K5E9_9APHY|nr:Ubiquitin ligase complex F-box protein GRR1, putative [Ganoderma boninense]